MWGQSKSNLSQFPILENRSTNLSAGEITILNVLKLLTTFYSWESYKLQNIKVIHTHTAAHCVYYPCIKQYQICIHQDYHNSLTIQSVFFQIFDPSLQWMQSCWCASWHYFWGHHSARMTRIVILKRELCMLWGILLKSKVLYTAELFWIKHFKM